MVRRSVRARLAAWYVLMLPALAVAPVAVAAPSGNADALIISLADVERITGRDDLVAETVQDAPAPQSRDPHAPAVCQAVYGQEDTFGSDWKQFRTAAYSVDTGVVKTMAVVMQAVGLYADGKTARAAFDRLVPTLEECSELHENFYDFTVTKPDSSTVVLTYREYQRSVIYQVKSSALINVVAAGFPEPTQTASVLMDKIAGRVK